MPISTRGLGMATNATQNVAQLVAALSQQRSQSVRGIGDTIRQAQEGAFRRKMAEEQAARQQQQVDFQQGQALGAQAMAGMDRQKAEQQRQALASMVGQQTGQDLSGLASPAIQAMMQNFQRQQAAQASREHTSSESALDRGHSAGLEATRQSGMDARQRSGLDAGRSNLDTRLAAQREGRMADQTARSREGQLNRLFSFGQNQQDRANQRHITNQRVESSEKIAGMRAESPGRDPAAERRNKSMSTARTSYYDLLEKIRSPMKVYGGEKLPDPAMRAKLQDLANMRGRELMSLLNEELLSYEEGQEPPALIEELDRLAKDIGVK